MALATDINSSGNTYNNNNSNLFEIITAPHDLRIYDLSNTEKGAGIMYCSVLTL